MPDDEFHRSRVFDIWMWKSDLDKRVKDYCLKMCYELDYSDEKMREWVIKLYQEIQVNSDEGSDESSCSQKGSDAMNIEDTINKIIEFAFRIAEKCVYGYLNAMDNNKAASECLHQIVIDNPRKVAYELLQSGMSDSWLYPEMPVVSGEIMSHKIY